ncbi:hypothetical protein [Cryobacterium sp. Y57]|nr:hypothetical protein [Cryobacterium sp. Y57]
MSAAQVGKLAHDFLKARLAAEFAMAADADPVNVHPLRDARPLIGARGGF